MNEIILDICEAKKIEHVLVSECCWSSVKSKSRSGAKTYQVLFICDACKKECQPSVSKSELNAFIGDKY